jgi:hypothetical protein
MSQEARYFPFESGFPTLQRQFLIILLSYFTIPGGISKEHIKKMGIELRHDLIICNLSPQAKKVEEDTNLLSDLSTSGISVTSCPRA